MGDGYVDSDAVDFTSLCRLSDGRLVAIGYKFIPKRTEEDSPKKKDKQTKNPSAEKGEKGVVSDPAEEEEEQKSMMSHTYFIFEHDSVATHKKHQFSYATEDSGKDLCDQPLSFSRSAGSFLFQRDRSRSSWA